MSPSNINSFVGDLVQMAKAMEILPEVQAELDRANTQIESYAKQVQDREMSIIRYKQEIDDLHAKVRSLEVERDDASFRVLEAEDTAHSALALVRTASVDLAIAIQKLDPPKPEPVKEPEPQAQPVAPPADWEQDKAETSLIKPIPEAVSSISELPGQSESSPTVKEEGTSLETASSPSVQSMDVDMTAGELTHGPYFGKRYIDVDGYVSYHDWIAGGGTNSDYYGGRGI